MLFTGDQHLHDWHTLRLFISGRDKKTSSPTSRSSSGFESSHLPSPECPTHPPTLTSTSDSKTCQPFILPSPRLPKSSLSLLSPDKGQVPSKTIPRSKSCLELQRVPAAGQVRRSFSLTIIHNKQERRLIRPKDWNLAPSVKGKESPQGTADPQTSCPVTSATSHRAECSTFSRDGAETTARPRLQPPPTVPTTTANLPLLTASLPATSQERSLTETACVCYTDHMSAEGTRSLSLSANFEARKLKKARKKVNAVTVGSLVEETPRCTVLEPLCDD